MNKIKHQVHGVDSSLAVRIDYDKCVGCQMCVKACSEIQKIGCLCSAPLKTPPFPHSVSGKNHENTATTRVKLSDTNCIGCGQCATYCSTGAIQPTNLCSEISVAKSQGLTLIAVLAPSTRLGVAEGMGMPIGTSAQNQIVSGLRQLGFQYVFDNLWGADLTTIEDAQELLKLRKEGKGPVFTSCCPAWINLVEQKYPEVIPKVSTCKSPNAITCTCIKRFWSKTIGKKPQDLFVVGIMPCTAKKFECVRPQLTTDNIRDCDLSITSREVIELFKGEQIQFSLEREKQLQGAAEARFDAPFNVYSGSAYIFGRTGGVTESVIRHVFKLSGMDFSTAKIDTQLVWESTDQLQSIKLVSFEVKDQQFKIIVCHGGSAVDEMMKIYTQGKFKGIDCIEVMMCPQGCIGGGGQPKLLKKSMTAQRPKGLDEHDQSSKFRVCSENQPMLELVQNWAPTEADRYDAFHTHYEDRKMK